MNAEEFIDTIKEVVCEDSIKGVHSLLFKPPGRQPNDKVTTMSQWYNRLNDPYRSMVTNIIRETVEAGIFGFLCLLVGVSAIENGPNKGSLKLYF